MNTGKARKITQDVYHKDILEILEERNTCDYEESDYGKYFFDTKDEAEKFWEERYGSDTNGN